MKWLYIAVGIALFIKILLMPNPAANMDFDQSIVEVVVQESGVSNAVSGIIFRNRLYVSVLVFIILSVITLVGYELPHGELGALVSGGILLMLNILVAVRLR